MPDFEVVGLGSISDLSSVGGSSDLDVQIRGERGGGGGEGRSVNQPPRQGGLALTPKNICSALGASVWSKNKGATPRAPPLDPPLYQPLGVL